MNKSLSTFRVIFKTPQLAYDVYRIGLMSKTGLDKIIRITFTISLAFK